MACQLRHITFASGEFEVAADLRLPDSFCDGSSYAAVVLVTPGSSVKEQIGGIYGQRLAERGFVTLTFDPSFQGESGGDPRDLESPSRRIEDVRCAIDHLMTLPYIGEKRVGVFGLCAGGGYAVSAAMSDRRVRALGTVVAVNIGRAFRQAELRSGSIAKTLEAAGTQRTVEARGGAERRDPWIPDTPEAARQAGVTDRDVLDAVDFYRTARGYNERSTNRLYFAGVSELLAYDAFHLVEALLAQPVQLVVGGRLGTTFSFEDGKTLFTRAPRAVDIFVVEGAGHYDLYDKAQYVSQAVQRLAGFFQEHLSCS